MLYVSRRCKDYSQVNSPTSKTENGKNRSKRNHEEHGEHTEPMASVLTSITTSTSLSFQSNGVSQRFLFWYFFFFRKLRDRRSNCKNQKLTMCSRWAISRRIMRTSSARRRCFTTASIRYWGRIWDCWEWWDWGRRAATIPIIPCVVWF